MIKKTTISINNYDNHLVISANDASNLIDHVPALVYRAHLGPRGIIMGKDRARFSLPPYRFGKHKDYIAQIKSSYDPLGNNNGILLYGDKGAGKSLLAEEVGNWMITKGLPVIMVSEPMDASELSIIIKAVGPCMVYFDEFGKVYHDVVTREQLLPLFSDTSFQGVMFILTGNDVSEFSSHLSFRPQRFRFMIKYENVISKETMADVLSQLKVKPQFHESFYEYGKNPLVNFDSLLCVIRECASCGSLSELHSRIEILNVPDFPKVEWYIKSVKVLRDLPEEEEDKGYGIEFRPNADDVSGTITVKNGVEHSSPWSRGSMESIDVENLDPLSGDVTIFHDSDREYEITLTYGFPKAATGCTRRAKYPPKIIDQAEPRGTFADSFNNPRGRNMFL